MQNNQSKNYIEYHNLIQIYERNVIKYHQLEIRSNTNELVQKYANDRKLSKLAAKFPLLKILKMVIRKFLLNDLEILIFIYFLDKLEWNYTFFLSENYVLPEFIINVEVQDFKEYHSLNLYCICVAYFTKSRLNQDMNIYDCHFQYQIQNFSQIYEKWEYQFQKYLQINLIDINKIHKKFQINLNDNFEYNFDYNALVDSIIQISPPNKGQKQEQQTQQKNISENHNFNNKNEMAFAYEDSNSLNNFNDNIFIEDDNLYSDQFCFSQQ